MTISVVVGNPKPASRTLSAAVRLAELLGGRAPGSEVDHVVDLIELGPKLLDWDDDSVNTAKRAVAGSSLTVVASPTFKATYAGLLKLFLDQFDGGTGLQGVVAVPLMLGAGPAHALAPEVLLRPVLSELGATCALPGLYLHDKTWLEDGTLDAYVERWTPVVRALTAVAA